jgi:ribosomal protein L27
MTHQQNRTLLPRQHAIDGSNIIGKRGERILNGTDMVAAGRKRTMYAFPAGAVDLRTVNEHDILH